MYFLTFILKNLIRRRVRSVLTIMGVAVAVGAVVALLGITHGFERSFLEIYEKRGVDLVVVQAGKIDVLTSFLDEKIADQLKQIPGVRSVLPGIVDPVAFEGVKTAIPVQGWPADSYMFNELKILSGHRLQEGDRRKVMLGTIAAINLGKQVGDRLEIYGQDFEVIGIYESFTHIENGSVVVLIRDLQDVLGLANKVTGFQIVVEDPGNPVEIEAIRRQIQGLGLNLSATPIRDYVSSNTQIRIAHAMAWVTSIIALFIGVIGVLNTMAMSVFERTREIGILRAIGWRKSRVIRMVLSESILLSLTGAVTGTLGAIAVVHVLHQLPEASGFVQGEVSVQVVLYGFGIALIVGLLGGAYPAYRGARLLPTEALRHE
jgi:putative ABC transport system permease protein